MGDMITPCFTHLHAINKDGIIEPHPTSSVCLVYIYHNSLELLSHIHDFYQDLSTTKLDLKVVLGRAAAWQLCRYVLSERLSYDSHTAHYDAIRYFIRWQYDLYTTCFDFDMT